jgi:hypothetical protein
VRGTVASPQDGTTIQGLVIFLRVFRTVIGVADYRPQFRVGVRRKGLLGKRG